MKWPFNFLSFSRVEFLSDSSDCELASLLLIAEIAVNR